MESSKMKIICLLAVLLIGVDCSSSNKEKWDSIIKKVNSAGLTWKAGYNFNSNISSFKRLLGSTFDKEYDGPYFNESYRSNSNEINDPIPSEYDSRKQWPKCTSINHIRDQGDCGSCWAVSAAEAFTDRFCIAQKSKVNPPFSSEDLLTCCNDCGHGCEGGSPWYAWNYFRRYGLVTGGDYDSNEGCKPYSLIPCEHHVQGQRPACSVLGDPPTPACHHYCTNRSYHKKYFKDRIKVKNFYIFQKDNVEDLQRDIIKNGPVTASFHVYEDFMTYKSGIYQYTTGNKLGGHAVKIIGWGEENNIPYWLISNSWNTDWGENGYFRIKRGVNECNIENFAIGGTF